MTVRLIGGSASLADWRAIYEGASVALDPGCQGRVAASAAAVGRIVARGEPVYGVNTGFGKLATVRIADADLATLQRNIVLSHAAGRRRARVGRCDAAHDGAEARIRSRRAPRASRAGTLALLEAMLARGADARRAGARVGRRVGRSRAARPHGRGDDRRRRGALRRRRPAGRRRARARRA